VYCLFVLIFQVLKYYRKSQKNCDNITSKIFNYRKKLIPLVHIIIALYNLIAFSLHNNYCKMSSMRFLSLVYATSPSGLGLYAVELRQSAHEMQIGTYRNCVKGILNMNTDTRDFKP